MKDIIKTILIVFLGIYSILATTGYCELNENNKSVKNTLKETRTELDDYRNYYEAAEELLECTETTENQAYKNYLNKLSVIQQYEENDI